MFLFTAGLAAQITVTGHVTAEVVEAVSAISGTKNLLTLQQNTTPENLDLGSFALSGGSSAICSVVVNTTRLTSEDGNRVPFSADPEMVSNNGIMNDEGTRVFNFNGNVDREILNSGDKKYAGSYNVVFAYN